MLRTLAIASLTLLLAAAAEAASPLGDLQLFENTLGAPGIAAVFEAGSGLVADVDLDADSAEGGGLLQGATEIELRPTGSVVFVDFVCEFQGACREGIDYVFTPGGEGQGALVFVSDPDFQEQNGLRDVGAITFDSNGDPGTIELADCNYTGQDVAEYRCTPATLATMPEPGRGWALLVGALAVLGLRRGRSRER